MKILKEESGENTLLAGCGMPISAGIGFVDIMRIGPDTAPYWTKTGGFFLNSGSILGVKNSIRNTLARATMNKLLWINDPDCLLIRKKKTKLNHNQRLSQINIIILSGGALFFSDNLAELSNEQFIEMKKIIDLSNECYKGQAIALDLMEKTIPELFYNTSGFLGIFNFKMINIYKEIDLNPYKLILKNINFLEDVWTGEKFYISYDNILFIKNMTPYSSKLLKIN